MDEELVSMSKQGKKIDHGCCCVRAAHKKGHQYFWCVPLNAAFIARTYERMKFAIKFLIASSHSLGMNVYSIICLADIQ